MMCMDKMAAYGREVVLQILLFLSCIILFSHAKTDSILKRKVSSSFLCQHSNETSNTIHTKAVGPDDILHYVMSLRGVPSVLVVRTSTDGDIEIDCDRFYGNLTEMGKSITFTKQHYAYALMINRLFEYDDTEDVADLNKLQANTSWHTFDLDKIAWSDFEPTEINDNKIVFKVNTSSEGLSFKADGSLSLEVDVIGAYNRDSLLPHLEYNANMTRFNLVLDNINTTFSNARFAIEMTMVSLDGHPDTMNIRTATYIDDEHSPGVFQMIDWTTKGQNQDRSGFFQFKPVCYTSSKRSLEDATKAVFYGLQRPNWTSISMSNPPSVAYAYFGMGMYVYDYSLTVTNVSFGLSKDKFYTKTNYTVWSASVGFGTPPADEISLVIIIILSVGLGLPILLILFGSIGICVKKRRTTTAYEEITSDEPVVN